jgi:hypothetical protein
MLCRYVVSPRPPRHQIERGKVRARAIRPIRARFVPLPFQVLKSGLRHVAF